MTLTTVQPGTHTQPILAGIKHERIEQMTENIF